MPRLLAALYRRGVGRWVVRLWGLGRAKGHLVYDAEQVAHGLPWRDSHPVWPPDGRSLAFARARTGERGDDERIMRLDLDSGDLTDLGEGAEPDWSPDGNQATTLGEGRMPDWSPAPA